MIIWIASYPKSGNTYVRSFLSSYYFSKKGKFEFDLLLNIKQFPALSYSNIKSYTFLDAANNWINNQNIYFNKEAQKYDSSIVIEKYIKMVMSTKDSLGLNAMTISDLTGIPRPTVLRKLNKLIKNKWISKDKKGLYKFSPNEKNYKDLNDLRLENIIKISETVAKFYNTARIYSN